VIPGAIDVTAAGQVVTLDRPELAVFVPRSGAPPIGPFALSTAGLLALQSLLRTVPEPGGGDGKNSHTARNVLIGAAGVAAAVAGISILGGKKKKKQQAPQSPINGGSRQ
jgi:hypothetical protein